MDAAGPVSRPALAGRFRLEEKLGSDAAGETYRAVEVDGDGAAVVRIVRTEGGSARRDRLLRETKRAAQVKHEGLAVVLDVGQTEDGDMFVAVEKIEGERLSDRLRTSAPLPEHEAAGIAAQIARALAAAHDAGVVHRDLHPSLIALSGAGEATRVKVEGLATPRTLAEATSSDAAAGNAELAFAAPEQRRGEAVGRRADVYSIGAMLYAMLTGDTPSPDAPVIESALGDVVRRCLADDPRERFLDTIALGAALRAAMDPAPTAAPASVRASTPSVRPGPTSGATPAPPPSTRVPSRPISVRPAGSDSAPILAARPPAAPPPRPLGRPLTARPKWEETLLDLRDGPVPRVALTVVVAFVIARILTSGLVPFVVAIVAGVAAYAVKFWRGSRG
ncbi:MAG: serine/threonine protein kinase [Myxococcaceae bacterium]|nr:serine/threonine protein kinase [Myxococcaceae bacterium]